MSEFLSSFRKLFSGSAPGRNVVAEQLRKVMEDGIKLELQPENSLLVTPPMIAVTIESLQEGGFRIHQPAADAARHLIKGREYHLGYYEDDCRVVGKVTCLGRAKYSDERHRTVYTFRFSMPETLRHREQRQPQTRGKKLDGELEAELTTFELRSPIFGSVITLGKHTAKIRCHNAMNKLQVGQDLFLKLQLPRPVGLLTEKVRLTGLQPDPQGQELLITVMFHDRISRLDEYLDRDAPGRTSRKAG